MKTFKVSLETYLKANENKLPQHDLIVEPTLRKKVKAKAIALDTIKQYDFVDNTGDSHGYNFIPAIKCEDENGNTLIAPIYTAIVEVPMSFLVEK